MILRCFDPVVVRVPAGRLNEESVARLAELLARYPDDAPVHVTLGERTLSLGPSHAVDPRPKLSEWLGDRRGCGSGRCRPRLALAGRLSNSSLTR